MRQQHRLCGLQMCLAGHDRRRVRGRLRGERLDETEHSVGHPAHRVTQPHPQQRGHLIVARPSGPQPAAEVGADPVDESTFQCAVDVLVGEQWGEAAVGDVGTQAVQSDEQ